MRWFSKRLSIEVTYIDWREKIRVTRTSFNLLTGVSTYVVRLENGDRVVIKVN